MLRLYVDSVFGVHCDTNSHTGMMVTMGQGDARSNFTTQKLNTKISKEKELVFIDDEISLIIWSRYFLAEQGYQVRDKNCYQDNHSTTNLAKNVCTSSRKGLVKSMYGISLCPIKSRPVR